MSVLPVMKIKEFSVDGVAIDGETIVRIRPQIETMIIEQMRSKGYVPVIDLTPSLFWEYNKDDNTFSYVIIVYGSYVGKRKAKDILGILGHRPIMAERDESH